MELRVHKNPFCDSQWDIGVLGVQIYFIELDTKAKCRHLKNCAGTLRPVFIRIYRLGIQSVMLVQLCELLSL
jgi:hypothetical protein